MQLAVMITALLLVIEAQSASPGVAAPLTRLLLIGGLLTALAGFAWQSSRQLVADIRHAGIASSQQVKQFQWIRRIHGGLWFGSVLLITYGLRWPTLVRYHLQLDGTVLLDDCCYLLPVWLPLVFSWSCFYDIEQSLRSTFSPARNRFDTGHAQLAGSHGDHSRLGRREYIGLHVRHHLAIILLPLLLLLTAYDLCELLWAGDADELPWFVHLSLLAAMSLSFPWLLRGITRSVSLPAGPQRDQLQSALTNWQIRVRDILLWRTSGEMLNAAVTGIIPGLRYLMLTDGILRELPPAQLMSVLAHEAAHLKRRHIGLRFLLLGVSLLGWLSIRSWLADPFWLSLAGVAWVAMTLAALAWLSQLMELDADCWAWQQVNQLDARPQDGECGQAENKGQGERSNQTEHPLVLALRRLSVGQPESRWASWLHPSAAARIAALSSYDADPERAVRVASKLPKLAAALLLSGLACAGWLLLS